MNSVKFDLIRKEYMLLDWFAAVGGLVSVALALAQIISLLESPHYFVTSAMIAQEQEVADEDEDALGAFDSKMEARRSSTRLKMSMT